MTKKVLKFENIQGLEIVYDDDEFSSYDTSVSLVFDPSVHVPEIVDMAGMTRVQLNIPYEAVRRLVVTIIRERAIKNIAAMDDDSFEDWLIGA